MAVSNQWKMSSLAYFLDFFTAPLFVLAALYLGPFHWVQAVCGLLLWSLIEYLTHRFLFHIWYRREHWTHHVDELAYIGISGWTTSAVYAALLVLAWATQLTSAYAGLVAGYLLYISLHYVMHRPSHWCYRFIPLLVASHDLHHHKGIEKNFGVSSPLWDFVFGTYIARLPDEGTMASAKEGRS